MLGRRENWQVADRFRQDFLNRSATGLRQGFLSAPPLSIASSKVISPACTASL